MNIHISLTCSVAQSSPAIKFDGPPNLASNFPNFFIVLDILFFESLFLIFLLGSIFGTLLDFRATVTEDSVFAVVLTTFPVAFPVSSLTAKKRKRTNQIS